MKIYPKENPFLINEDAVKSNAKEIGTEEFSEETVLSLKDGNKVILANVIQTLDCLIDKLNK